MKKNLHRTPLSKRKMEYQDEESILHNPRDAFEYYLIIYRMIASRNVVVKLLMIIIRLSSEISEILENPTRLNGDVRQLHEGQLSFANLELQEIIKSLNEVFSRLQIFGLSIEDQQMLEESSVILPREMSKYPITIINLCTKMQKMVIEKFYEGQQATHETCEALVEEIYKLLEIKKRFEKETAFNLSKLADDMQQHVASLNTLGVSAGSEMLVHFMESKLPKVTLEKWDITLERDEFPKPDQMYEFLYKTAVCASKRERSKALESDKNKAELYCLIKNK
ncbi:PREDICTED: uncharacterized protein LOC105451309 [Wasmannia auropunctata]|uniref:uncharacterized protein LOC105451309 n=1 Tax=Wasmannia auropunctata TaxID=64793 RepID=UPI0005ED600F|nr:PREDICTED: uncharacterized protein LOC105451309 [Wasmannia auropunctata]